VIKLQSHIKIGNLFVVQQALHHGIDLPQWYVATTTGTLIFGPFSNLEGAVEAAKRARLSGSASEKEP
jgi:hypothetical protein